MECMLGSAMYLKSTGMSLEEAERAVGTLGGGATPTERAREALRKKAGPAERFVCD